MDQFSQNIAYANRKSAEQKVEDERQKKLQSQVPLKFPSDLTDDFYIEFNAFKVTSDRPQEVKRTFQFTKSVYLPFPSSITDQYGASYAREDLFFGGEALKQGLNSLMKTDGTNSVSNLVGNGVMDRVGQAAAAGMRKLASDPMGAVKSAGAAVGAYALTGLGGPPGAAMKAAFNVTTNPYPVMIFQGTGFKSFGFSWTFYPESKKESDTIKKIIGYFRREMLPEKLENAPSIMAFPAIFEVFVSPEVKQFKRCVVTSLDVNYTPSGPAFVKEFPVHTSPFMEPAAITMSIGLQEIEIWTANDFYSSEENDFDFIKNKDTKGITRVVV